MKKYIEPEAPLPVNQHSWEENHAQLYLDKDKKEKVQKVVSQHKNAVVAIIREWMTAKK